MSTAPAGFDFDALAEWAESDEATHTPQTSPVFRGEDAARASRAFLGRGRPTRLPRLRGGEPNSHLLFWRTTDKPSPSPAPNATSAPTCPTSKKPPTQPRQSTNDAQTPSQPRSTQDNTTANPRPHTASPGTCDTPAHTKRTPPLSERPDIIRIPRLRSASRWTSHRGPCGQSADSHSVVPTHRYSYTGTPLSSDRRDSHKIPG
ncbi:hypothetical protein HMPREF1485_00899 [Propionibacterium sp. HGH0353]|nr:hypothetical protein HMPREF1485_00899 [Propionibacterium sp. HGH0353]